MKGNKLNAKEYILIAMSLAAIVLSLISICKVYPRTSDFGLDYQGWIVGVLSLLVTILIGWQIFTLIDIKRIRQEIYSKEIHIYNRSELNISEFHIGMFTMYINMEKQGYLNVYELLNHGLCAIVHQSRINIEPSSNEIIVLLLGLSREIKKAKLTQEQIKALLSLLSEIQNSSQLDRYIDLCGLLWILQDNVSQDGSCQ